MDTDDRCVNCGSVFGDWHLCEHRGELVADCLGCDEQGLEKHVGLDATLTADARRMLDVEKGGTVLSHVFADGRVGVHDFATKKTGLGATLLLAMTDLSARIAWLEGMEDV